MLLLFRVILSKISIKSGRMLSPRLSYGLQHAKPELKGVLVWNGFAVLFGIINPNVLNLEEDYEPQKTNK